MNNEYSLVGGHVHINEKIRIANHREIREEIGLLPGSYVESPFCFKMNYRAYETLIICTTVKVPFSKCVPKSEIVFVQLMRYQQFRRVSDFWREPLKILWTSRNFNGKLVSDMFYNSTTWQYHGKDVQGLTLDLIKIPYD